jgi:hypothetical protein
MLYVRTSSGNEFEVENTPDMVSNYDKDLPGDQSVTFLYKGLPSYAYVHVQLDIK